MHDLGLPAQAYPTPLPRFEMSNKTEQGTEGGLPELPWPKSWARMTGWFPALFLLLYALGYVSANAHYSRYEIVKPTLLEGRYLAAGMLLGLFAVIPAFAGFLGAWLVRTGDRPTKIAAAVIVPAASLVYFGVLCQAGMIEVWRFESWTFFAAVFVAAAGVSLSYISREARGTEADSRAVGRLFGGMGLMISMISFAYVFGTLIYPWVKPTYGGAALRLGDLELRQGSPGGLVNAINQRPTPFVDMDDKFLYVVGCPENLHASGVVMVPLEFVATGGISHSTDDVALPDYLKQFRCTEE